MAFLLSDEGRYITGTSLPVDAGFVNRDRLSRPRPGTARDLPAARAD